jgi:hypothetical protein
MRDQYGIQEAAPVFLHALHHARDCWERARHALAKLERDIDRAREEIIKLETTMHALEHWESAAASHTPRPETSQGQSAAQPKAADTATPRRRGRPASPRMIKVLDLLKQDPASWWKNRQIADAIGEDPRLLRMTLSYLVDDGRLLKNTNACYRYSGENQKAEQH